VLKKFGEKLTVDLSKVISQEFFFIC